MISLRPLADADIPVIKAWPRYPPEFAGLDYSLRDGGWLDAYRKNNDTGVFAATDGSAIAGFSLLLWDHDGAPELMVALSGRQMKIVEFIHANGSVKSGDLVRQYGISRQAAGKELAQMVGQNLIRPEGKGRATRYVMVWHGCRFKGHEMIRAGHKDPDAVSGFHGKRRVI